jgi:hypothetical protein
MMPTAKSFRDLIQSFAAPPRDNKAKPAVVGLKARRNLWPSEVPAAGRSFGRPT